MNTQGHHHNPVIVLLDSQRSDTDEIDLWLAQSRYSTYEAISIFNVLEQISDFTVRDTPEVVYLHVDGGEAERRVLEEMLPAYSTETSISVIAVPESSPRQEISSESMLASL